VIEEKNKDVLPSSMSLELLINFGSFEYIYKHCSKTDLLVLGNWHDSWTTGTK